MLELGKAIQIVRQAKKLSLGEAAKRADVSIAFLSLIESNKRQPSLAVMRRLAEAMDVPPETLIILAQPTEGTLESKNGEAKGLVDAIRKLVAAEDALRENLQSNEKRGNRGKKQGNGG
jgi:transcriptional regulator with XRE-family HTH domain